MAFNIPHKQKNQETITLPNRESDNSLLNGLRPELKDMVTQHFNELNAQEDKKIASIIKTNKNQKDLVVKQSNESFLMLMKLAEETVNKPFNKMLDTVIQGKYDSSYIMPSYEYWKECNVGFTIGIDMFEKEMNDRGYTVNMKINPYKVDHCDNYYSDGNWLLIESDMN
mgnify:CR=1 FL=1